MLIGRGGETIKDLKKESGARIDIAKEADEEGSTDRQVHITGPPECVEFAKKMIEDMLGKSRESREGKDGQRKSGGRVIKVPTDMIGVLIGRGGETISKIQRESSARIEIHKDDREALDRQVTITGSADNIEKAIRAIDDVLDGAERAGKGSRRADPGKEFKHAGVSSSFLVRVAVVRFYVQLCSSGADLDDELQLF
ncbi:Khsrp [Symbiodinium sp. CCMP2592]|nr:Khsrp [Symbiodinium sp. CCMP2592]